MGTWTSLVVLSLAVVIALSFPRPDAEYKIPNVGLGTRAQYYVLHSDGSYKYGYDSGDGLYEQSMAQAPGEVTGAFGYKDPTGENVNLEYTADERGFIPRGSHLPVAPEADFGSRVRTSGTSQVASGNANTVYSAAPETAPLVPAPPPVPVEIANIRSTAAGDGSYSFGYKTSASSRSESADAQNSVTGEYAFVADDGVNRAIKYIAGAQTGYIAEGDSLPRGPVVPGAESGIPTGRIYPILSEEEANALAAATSGSSSASAYTAQPSSATAAASSSISSSDASYSFQYDAGDSSRQEKADADLNIEGSYSFLPPEGHRLTVNYVAGSDTGFLASGDHLPVAPVAAPVTKAATATAQGATSYSAASAATSVVPSPAPVETAQVRSSASEDGSYSFGYETSSSSRSESADSKNSVTGHYAFVADDGINRAIKYIASSATGYIAEGEDLPQGPPVPGAESGIPTGRIYPILSEDEANALAAATSGSSLPTTYTAQSSSAAAAPAISSLSTSDASYSFQYDAGESTREESADSDLNIKGSFSFVPPEGHRLTVNYVAGSDTGFVATGDHLPVAPKAETVPSSAPSAITYNVPPPSLAATPVQFSSAPSDAVASSNIRPRAGSSDASYSFSYDAGESTRSESADADLNVEGSFSFVPPDGDRLTVNYLAGSRTGFVATGDHLPVAPATPSDTRAASVSTGVAAYSAPSPVTTQATLSGVAAATPVEVAQVRSASGDDGSYSFAYETSSSSRSETADAHNSVTGHYTFVADDGINRNIKYIAGAETGYIAEGEFLPQGPPVPGAESGIPTGRILPVLSEEEANALAEAVSGGVSSPLLKTTAGGIGITQSGGQGVSLTPSDASYSFSFASDSYSRNEEADADGNIVGSYMFLDEDGNKHTVNFVAGRETGFLPEGFPTPQVDSFSSGAAATFASTSKPVSSPSKGSVTQTKYSAPTSTANTSQRSSSTTGHRSHVIGDVLLHQYDVTNDNKYGYAFSALRR